MRAAISIGARVIPVDVARQEANYIGSWEGLISGEQRRLEVTGLTYEEALQALRTAIMAAFAVPRVHGSASHREGPSP